MKFSIIIFVVGGILAFPFLCYSQSKNEEHHFVPGDFYKASTKEALFSRVGNHKNIRGEYRNYHNQDSVLTHVGDWLWGECDAVDIKGNLAFIGNGPYVHTMDISDPGTPRIVGEYMTPWVVTSITVRDSLAYVTTWDQFLILNITDPYHPTLVSQAEGVFFAVPNVVVRGRYLYIPDMADMRDELMVVDVGDPAHPIIHRIYDIGCDNPPVIKDSVLYLIDYEWGHNLVLFNVSNPLKLKQVGTLPLGPEFNTSLFIMDTLLLIGASDSLCYLRVFSVRDPLHPFEISRDTLCRGGEINPFMFGSAGTTAFIGINSGTIYAVDVSSPASPRVIASKPQDYSSSVICEHLVCSDSLIAVAACSGVDFIRWANHDSLKEKSFFITGGDPFDVVVKGGYAYVTEGLGGLAIFDISNPSTLQRVSAIQLPAYGAGHLVLNGNYVYIGAAESLQIVDVTNPLSPQYVKGLKNSWPVGLVIQNNYLYVTRHDSGLVIYDLTDPINPQRRGTFSANHAGYLSVQDSICITTTFDGLIIIDVANPDTPGAFGAIAGSACGQIIRDTLLYAILFHDSTDFAVYSIKNPRELVKICSTRLGLFNFTTCKISSSGNFLYFGGDSLYAINLSNPYSPFISDLFAVGGYMRGSYAKGQYVYYCDYVGLHVVRNDLITGAPKIKDAGPSEFSLLQNYPNPFNPNTTIKYTLPKSSHVTLKIFDILGRELKTLVNGTQEAGYKSVQFSAHNLPSGIYFYRLQAGGFMETKKLLVIR